MNKSGVIFVSRKIVINANARDAGVRLIVRLWSNLIVH